MSSNPEAQKDLVLDAKDAENVVGGRALRHFARKARHAVSRAVGSAGPNINIQTPRNPVEDAGITASDPQWANADSGNDN